MAKLVLKNAKVTVNSVDLSDHVEKVTLDLSYADVETTAMGTNSKTRTPGLGDHKLTIDFHQDFAAASVDATINGVIGTNAAVTVEPVSGATTTVNPIYVMTCSIIDHKPLDAKVGDLTKTAVTWPISGDVTRATT